MPHGARPGRLCARLLAIRSLTPLPPSALLPPTAAAPLARARAALGRRVLARLLEQLGKHLVR
jgi:hypothetical protein